MEIFTRMGLMVACFILMVVDVRGQLEFGDKKLCDKETILFGRTSDRELLRGGYKLETPREKKSAITLDRPEFYDPNYGFSQESMADILYNRDRNVAEESIVSPDVVNPLNAYHRHIYSSKYPQLGAGYNSFVGAGSSKASTNDYPSSYANSYLKKTEYDIHPHSPYIDPETFGESKGAYEKFLKDLFKDKHLAKLYQNDDDDPVRYWGGSKAVQPHRQYYDQGKQSSNKAYYDLLEQSKAYVDYLNKFSVPTETFGVNDAIDEADLGKYERQVPRRPPNNVGNNGRRRRVPAKCTGPRCPGRVRRPRFSPY